MKKIIFFIILSIVIVILFFIKIDFAKKYTLWPEKTSYHFVNIDGYKIFYRKAGDPKKPTILLLHGYPASSHSYRELIPLLSGYFHVIAPDNLGSGYSDKPDPDEVPYNFQLLAKILADFTDQLEIDKYVLYMQDFGAPTGFPLMIQQPQKLQALIVQNANAYLAGLTEKRQSFFKSANQDKSKEKLQQLYDITGRDAVLHKQYLRDVQDKKEIMSPDSWTHDLHFLEEEKHRKIQVQLFQDYYNNLLDYDKWQKFLHKTKPPTLILWGKNDPAFIAAGAHAYLRDLPNAELHLLDAGHFAVEEKPVEIAKYIIQFLR